MLFLLAHTEENVSSSSEGDRRLFPFVRCSYDTFNIEYPDRVVRGEGGRGVRIVRSVGREDERTLGYSEREADDEKNVSSSSERDRRLFPFVRICSIVH